MKKISIVLPALNEGKNIPRIVKQLKQLKTNYVFKYVIVDDGSTDDTWDQVLKISAKDKNVMGVSLSRNFGPQYALACGIKNCPKSDAVIIMDSDLQHPPKVVLKFIKSWEEGADIVNGVKRQTEKEPFTKKILSKLFYKLANFLLDQKIVPGGSDFKLYDKKVVVYLQQLNEYNRFLRGLSSWVGFKQDYVYFNAPKRKHGKPGYTFSKSFNLAKAGIISLSVKPLSLISILGLILILISSFALTLGIVRSVIKGGLFFSPIFNLMLVNILLIGVVLLCLGLVAIYLSFVYKEVINRPLYVIDKTVNLPKPV